MIEQRTTALVQQLDTTSDMRARNTGVRGLMAVQFFEKKRRKAWGFMKQEEEVCWEQWTLDVTLATPRTETGRFLSRSLPLQLTDGRIDRKSKGSKGHGGNVTEGCDEDCDYREPRKRPHPTHHHKRSKSISLSDCY